MAESVSECQAVSSALGRFTDPVSLCLTRPRGAHKSGPNRSPKHLSSEEITRMSAVAAKAFIDSAPDKAQAQLARQRQPFAMVPKSILCDSSVSLGARALYGLLTGYCWRREDWCEPSMARMVKDAGCSEGKIRRMLLELGT